MKIMITGAAGFVGSACVSAAMSAGHEVFAVVRPGSAIWRLPTSGVNLAYADLSEPHSVRVAMQRRPDVVINCAWHGVSANKRHDSRQITDNLLSSMLLIDAAVEAGVSKFIGIGSQAEYGTFDGKISEKSLPDPSSYYGSTKCATQLLSKQACADAGIGFAWLRLFATYGPGDNPNWLIPTLIEQMLRGERPRTTSGRQLVDYLFIDDVAAAVLNVAEKSGAQGVFNLGSGHAVTVREIVETIRDIVAPNLDLVFGEIPHSASQVWHMEADISRLTEATDFKPLIRLDEGLQKTISWHRSRAQTDFV